MRQLALTEILATKEQSKLCEKLPVYDIFCGAGGFSCGAAAAGCKIAYACDVDPQALSTHQQNHPTTKHARLVLPSLLPLPTDGQAFHLHGSPPCTLLSTINAYGRKDGDKQPALELVKWFLNSTELKSNDMVHGASSSARGDCNCRSDASRTFISYGIPRLRFL